MPSFEGLPLRVGAVGPAVRDLHRRLAEAGFPTADTLSDRFSDDTVAAVRGFQESRRIEVDGVVGPHTWGALAEAAHRLGDRLLYQKQSPMLRGDDVAELQRRLGALGFDAGRVDGIFGPDTAKALATFQRNAGLPTDGIFGPDCLAALNRLGGRGDQESVATVRERERLRSGGGLGGPRRLLIGELGGLGAVVDTCGRHLRHRGIRVDLLSHPDESHHALVANQLDVTGYLLVLGGAERRCRASYFATEGFESPGGHHLATLIVDRLTDLGFTDAEVQGQRLSVLRETRMPAVVLRIGPTTRLVRTAPDIAGALTEAISAWLEAPAGTTDEP